MIANYRWFRPGAIALANAAVATLATLLIALLPSQASGQADWPSSTSVLERAADRYGGIAGFCSEFYQMVEVRPLSRTVHSWGTLCQSGSDRFEMRWTDPLGDRIVADGAYLWTYFRSADPGQVMRATLARTGAVYDLHGEFLADPGTRYESQIEGLEQVDGREVWALSLRPLVSSRYLRARVWIDRNDYLVRRIMIEEDSERIRTIEFTSIRLNPAVDSGWFRFVPDRGVQVIDL